MTWERTNDPQEGNNINYELGSGVAFGGEIGYDHSFSDNLYGRVELGISESYDIYGFDFQRAIIGVALGTRF